MAYIGNTPQYKTIIDTVGSLTALRAYSGKSDNIVVTSIDGTGGMFVYDVGDTTSADDSNIVIVAGSKRWKRVLGRTSSLLEVSIRDFNILIGNGGDDSTTIQKAIDYVYALGGGTVIIPPGTFLAKNLVMRSGVHYRGLGGTIKTLPGALGAANDALFESVGNITNVKMKDLILDGNKGIVAGDEFSGVALVEFSHTYTASDVRIVGCRFLNNGYISLRFLSDMDGVLIDGCRFDNTDTCCWFGLAGAKNVRIVDSYFKGGTSEAVTIDLAGGFVYSNFIISNNVCTDKVSFLFSDGNITGLTVSNNTIAGSTVGGAGAAIRVDNGDGAVSGDNLAHATNVTIIGNSVVGHFTGVFIDSAINGTVSGNVIKNCYSHGIQSNSTKIVISNNAIIDVNLSGTTGYAGIYSSGDSTSISGNYINDTRTTKLQAGIFVSAGSKVIINDNNIDGYPRDTTQGIYISSGCTNVILKGNDVRGSVGSGSNNTYLASSATSVIVCANNTSDHGGTFTLDVNETVSARTEENITLTSTVTYSTIKKIDSISMARRTISVLFTGAGSITVTHNSGTGNIKTRTGANAIVTVGSIYQFVSDGTSWIMLN